MNIYFSGIGGVAIGPLAEIALDAGHFVSGSDMHESVVSKQLISRGVAVSYDQDGEFLRRAHADHAVEMFVYTAALPDNHPELMTARSLGIRVCKRDELISEILRNHNLKLIAVSGTHGKTTTTGMMIWVMKQLGIPVSYSIGTTVPFGQAGKFDKDSEYFVYECDEFDRNFLHFFPHLSLITSIDYDHPDSYPTEQEYLDAFQKFIDQSDHTILWQNDAAHMAIHTPAWILHQSEVFGMHYPGTHNRQNATLVGKGCEYLGLSTAHQVRHILEKFPGTNRRFERIAENLYSDYGHHPAEIAATLQMARELSDHVTLVYQPHQNIRQHQVRSNYTDCMNLAETIYWLPTYLAREDPNLPILSPEELTETLVNRDSVRYADMNDELWQSITTDMAAGKLVLCMGAGTIDEWLRSQLAKQQAQV